MKKYQIISWVMRDLWDVTSNLRKENKVENPIKLQSIGIKRLLERALKHEGIRSGLEGGKKRYEFQVDHGYRKFFKTKCEQSGMKPINVEILMGHSTGMSDSYYRATEKELLDDYLKAIDNLSVNEKGKLEKEIKEINQNNTDRISILQKIMKEKEVEIERLKEKDLINSDSLANLSDKLIKLMEKNEV